MSFNKHPHNDVLGRIFLIFVRTLTWGGLLAGRLKVFPRHLVHDLHEGRDQTVDVGHVVLARRLQDHQRAEQLRGRAVWRPGTHTQQAHVPTAKEWKGWLARAPR